MENFKIKKEHINQICEKAKSHRFDLEYVNCMNYKGTKTLYFKLNNYKMHENDMLKIHVKGNLFFFHFVVIRHKHQCVTISSDGNKTGNRISKLTTIADVEGLEKALDVVDDYFKELSKDL